MTNHLPARADRVSRAFATGMIVCAAILAAVTPPAHAGSDQRTGTNGAQELLIPVGPRGSALGPSSAADVSGIEGAYWNPAGLATIEGTEAMFTHTQYFADMNVNYAAVGVKASGFGVLGFSAKVLSIGSVLVTTEQAPDGTGETLNPTFTVLGMSWARQFTDRVNFGATIGYVSENIASMTASGVAADFGVQYHTEWHGMVLAMTVKNIGTTMSFNGDNLEASVIPPGAEPNSAARVVRFTTANFEMPSYFTLSSSGDAYRQGGMALRWMGSFQSNNFGGDNFNAGAEWLYHDQFALRGSWFGTFTTTSDALNGDSSTSFRSGDDLYAGYALGAGLNVKTGASKLGVDFAWRPVREFFNDTFEIGVRAHF